jgi:hypothetical protein
VRRAAACLGLLAALGISPAWAQDIERATMARVLLTTEAGVLIGCTQVGSVNDTSVKDLRKKIVRSGGNAGLLTFTPDDMSVIYAAVFLCPIPPGMPPTNIPPPPPGTPPLPPSR